MINYYLTNTNTWQDVTAIKNNGGIHSSSLSLAVNEPHQFKIAINSNLRQFRELLKTGSTYGIRLEGKRLNMGFVKARDPQVDILNGIVEITYYSPMWLLQYSKQNNNDVVWTKRSAIELLSRIDSRFVFTVISTDENISLTIGQISNLDLLKEIREQTGWTMVDAGFTLSGSTFKPEIIVGNQSDLKDFLKNDSRFTPIQAKQNSKIPNPFAKNSAIINSIKRNYSGQVFTHFLPIGDIGQGTAKNASLRLSNPTASYIKPDFPLIPETNPFTGEVEWFVFNGLTVGLPDVNYSRYKSEVYTLNANATDPELAQIFNSEDAERYLYNRAVARLKAGTLEESYSYDFTLNEVVMPCTSISIQYKEVINLLDNFKVNGFDINDEFFLRDVEFDLLKISN